MFHKLVYLWLAKDIEMRKVVPGEKAKTIQWPLPMPSPTCHDERPALPDPWSLGTCGAACRAEHWR